MAPVKKKGWVAIYKNKNGETKIYENICPSKPDVFDLIEATLVEYKEIEWEE